MKLMRNEKGLTLLEVMVALGLLGILIVAFLGAMAGASRAMFIADERATAESIARTQMEWVKNQEYEDIGPQSYEKTDESIPAYIDYTVTIGVTELSFRLQKITVIVLHNGNPVYTSGNYTLEGYKVDR